MRVLTVCLLHFSAFLFSGFAAELPGAGKTIEAPPAWVEPLRADPGSSSETNAVEGLRIALLDQQHNGATAERYQHVVRDLVNENGVQNGARVTVDFDPEYQSLAWHHVRIHRQGRTIDGLDPEKIKVIQMETDLDRHIYNGALSAVIFIEDARKGDQVDFAYTIRGSNPILKGRLADSFFLQYGVPIQQLRFRLVWPSDRRVWFKSFGVDRQPKVEAKGTITEYVWHDRDVPAANFEENCPVWAHPLPWVQLTEFGLWSEVARWAGELYPPPGPLPEPLREKIGQWRLLPNPSEAVRAALEFVQDEIRYLGFEAGTGSHRPSPPAEVFARRFGDCKDKTYLLVSILKELGIPTTPVLVHTAYQKELTNFLPSPFAFNHVIARVELGGKRLYLDPTRSFERGPVENRSADGLAYCLPIQADVVTLERLPIPSFHVGIAVYETYRVSKIGAPALLTVRSVLAGINADFHRAYLASITPEQHQKRCLDYYARVHAKIQNLGRIEVRDDPVSSRIEVTGQYSIPDFWRPTEDKTRHECKFYPYEIAAVLRRPAGSRTKPLLMNYPQAVTLRTEVQLPEKWPVKRESWGQTNAALEFTAERWGTGSNLLMQYSVRTLADHVPADKAAEHGELVDAALNSLGYSLYLGKPGGAVWTPNWSMIAATVFGAGLAGVGAVMYYRRLGPVAPPVVPEAGSPDRRLVGIGGWLVLVAIAVVLQPLLRLASLSSFSSVFSVASWQSLTTPGGSSYHPMWAPALLFELSGAVVLGTAAILQAVLFFQKRRAFPRVFILLLAATAAESLVDLILIQPLPSIELAARLEASRELFRAVVACGIWIPYMLRSVRVSATFTR